MYNKVQLMGVQEGSGVISDDREYNPKEEEVVVHKTVKALKESRTKRPGVKKTANKNRKSSEASVAMPSGKQLWRLRRTIRKFRWAWTLRARWKCVISFRRWTKKPLSAWMKAALSAYASGVVHLLLTGMMSSVKKNNILCFNQASSPSLLLVHFANGSDHHRLRKGKGLERITKSLGTKVPIQIAQGMNRPEKPLQAAKFASQCGLVARSHLPVLAHFKEYKNNATLVEDYIGKFAANFEINTDLETIKYACKDVLQKSSKNRRHNIKKKYFDTVAANKVSAKSPVPDLTDSEWQALKEEHKSEELSAIDLFKATHNSKKHGFSEPVKIAIPEMEKMKDAPGTRRNVGLKSSSNNSGKGTVVVAAHVRDLQQKLERSELQAKVMQEEMAAIKLKAEEYEATRDKELELLRKKS
ncbi:hypothetical protein D1007_52788 [Hordeum vulgare]|nr:hypothetical protein D1007_52788 [Hordeum vulgare]